MYTYEATVLVQGSSAYSAQPQTMTTQARNLNEARNYFQQFGKIASDPRLI
jgi:hypothetical protein